MGSQVNICLGLLKNNFFLLLTASCQLCSTVNFCRSLWQMRVLMALQHKSTKFNRSLLTFSGSPNCQNSYTLFSFLQTQRNRYNSSLPPPLFFFFFSYQWLYTKYFAQYTGQGVIARTRKGFVVYNHLTRWQHSNRLLLFFFSLDNFF